MPVNWFRERYATVKSRIQHKLNPLVLPDYFADAENDTILLGDDSIASKGVRWRDSRIGLGLTLLTKREDRGISVGSRSFGRRFLTKEMVERHKNDKVNSMWGLSKTIPRISDSTLYPGEFTSAHTEKSRAAVDNFFEEAQKIVDQKLRGTRTVFLFLICSFTVSFISQFWQNLRYKDWMMFYRKAPLMPRLVMTSNTRSSSTFWSIVMLSSLVVLIIDLLLHKRKRASVLKDLETFCDEATWEMNSERGPGMPIRRLDLLLDENPLDGTVRVTKCNGKLRKAHSSTCDASVFIRYSEIPIETAEELVNRHNRKHIQRELKAVSFAETESPNSVDSVNIVICVPYMKSRCVKSVLRANEIADV